MFNGTVTKTRIPSVRVNPSVVLNYIFFKEPIHNFSTYRQALATVSEQLAICVPQQVVEYCTRELIYDAKVRDSKSTQ